MLLRPMPRHCLALLRRQHGPHRLWWCWAPALQSTPPRRGSRHCSAAERRDCAPRSSRHPAPRGCTRQYLRTPQMRLIPALESTDLRRPWSSWDRVRRNTTPLHASRRCSEAGPPDNEPASCAWQERMRTPWPRPPLPRRWNARNMPLMMSCDTQSHPVAALAPSRRSSWARAPRSTRLRRTFSVCNADVRHVSAWRSSRLREMLTKQLAHSRSNPSGPRLLPSIWARARRSTPPRRASSPFSAAGPLASE